MSYFGGPNDSKDKSGKEKMSQADPMLVREFMEVYLQTQSPPLGDELDAWNWSLERAYYFRRRKLDSDLINMLGENMLMYLTKTYAVHIDGFLGVFGSATAIILTCESQLSKGNPQKAKQIADPYFAYLQQHSEKYSNGQKCFQDGKEEYLYRKTHLMFDAIEYAEDNFTYFWVLYFRILDSILFLSPEEQARRTQLRRTWMETALKISPCNATVYESLSRVYMSSDEKTYRKVIDKALSYTYTYGEPYGIGAIYNNLAVYYALHEPSLSYALCMISTKYGGTPTAARYILSKMAPSLAGTMNEALAIQILRDAGIQVGFSELTCAFADSPGCALS